MILRAFAVIILTAALPAAATSPAEELRAELERRLQVIEALRHSRPRACERLAELSHALPSSAVLSRLALTKNRLEVSLSQGSAEDARSIVQQLVTKDLCSKPVTSAEGSPVTASCAIDDDPPNEVWLRTPAPHAVSAEELRALRQKLDEAQTILPDVAELSAFDANLKDLAWKGLVKDWASDIGRAVRGDAVDSHQVTGSGSASFAGVAELICALDFGRRATSIESFELERPRVRNGEWVVDFRFAATTWRYRKEDEHQELRVPFRVVHEPTWAPGKPRLGMATERSPFGPPGAIFAGASLKLTGKECRKEGSAVTATEDEFEGREFDEFAVAFVAPKGSQVCAMLVDAKGECHELRRNTRFGPLGGKVTQIDGEAITVTRFANDSATGDGRPVSVKVALKVASKAAAPAWFCRQK